MLQIVGVGRPVKFSVKGYNIALREVVIVFFELGFNETLAIHCGVCRRDIVGIRDENLERVTFFGLGAKGHGAGLVGQCALDVLHGEVGAAFYGDGKIIEFVDHLG